MGDNNQHDGEVLQDRPPIGNIGDVEVAVIDDANQPPAVPGPALPGLAPARLNVHPVPPNVAPVDLEVIPAPCALDTPQRSSRFDPYSMEAQQRRFISFMFRMANASYLWGRRSRGRGRGRRGGRGRGRGQGRGQ